VKQEGKLLNVVSIIVVMKITLRLSRHLCSLYNTCTSRNLRTGGI